MKTIIAMATALLLAMEANAQSTFIARIKDSKTKEAVPGAVVTINGTQLGNTANENGIAIISNAPGGSQVVSITAMGYSMRLDTVSLPAATDTTVIYLAPEEMEEVTVSSTRSTRTIKDIPTRIELISGEELEEKADMKPGDIRMMLSESTGIQTLQTSATSGNSAIRIEGMDGRYTQILKDGFPLYSGFAGGLGLLQTPPLDLKQVEIVKGASSTLYGGGAIAGLVNLISKTPAKERELLFLLNGTSAGGLDVNGYYGQRYGKTGLTIYAARNSNEAYDPAGIGLSAIPKFERYTLNPRLFLYPNERTEITVGLSAMTEKRLGGDMQYIQGHGDSMHSYYEDNNSLRISAQGELKYRVGEQSLLSVKASADRFDRVIKMPAYTFDGSQTNSFSEVNFSTRRKQVELIGGVNFISAMFIENKITNVPLRSYEQTTAGVFGQGTWDISTKWILKGGYG